jgi:internalin A
VLTKLDAISRLKESLEALDVEGAPGAMLDLSAFPQLRELGASWRCVRETIASAQGLRELIVSECDETDLRSLVDNEQLTRVTLKDAPRLESLSGLDLIDAI